MRTPLRYLVAALVLVLAAAVEAAAPEPLTVMSFNIRYGTANDGENRWEARRSQLFGLLKAQDPDVVGLQEALHFQIDEILAAVPGYRMVGVGRTDGGQGGEYVAILYTQGTPFFVYNLHLDHVSQPAREKIDYIFVEPGTDVLSADIVRTATDGRYPSDHFPVVARIRFR